MTPEELLRTRFKVINDYPDCPFTIGQIIYAEDNGVVKLDKNSSARLEAYPHLFKKLEWWEERPVADMPKYVKYHQQVYLVHKHFIGLNKDHVKVYDGIIDRKLAYDYLLPAKEFEYTNFIHDKKEAK